MSARSDRQPGQGVVEFAIVSLVFFLMLFGIVEMGWYLFSYHEVTNAAREGARYAIVHGTMSAGITNSSDVADYTLDTTKLKSAILAKVNLTNPNSLSVTITEPDGNLQPGHHVKFTVTYPYHPLIGFIIGGGTITLRGSSTMVIYY